MAFRIKWDGMDAVCGHLQESVKLDAVKTCVKFHGSEMQTTAQICCPVKTGFLKDSIELDIADEGMTAIVEPYAEYAGYVEWGTRFMRAQPYIRPAYFQERERFFDSIGKLCK